MYLSHGLLAIASLLGLAQAVPPAMPSQYVVKLTDSMSQVQFDQTMGLVRSAIGTTGQVMHEYNFHDFRGFSFEAPTAVMNAVQAIPGVEVLHPNYMSQIPHQSTQRTEFDPTGYALDRISHRNPRYQDNRNPPQFVYYLPDGQYMTLYVIDTGIRITHEDFGGRAVHGANFAPDNVLGYAPRDPVDYIDHGTPVAGLAAGTQYGVAKYANIVDIRVYNDNGTSSYSDSIAAINYAVNDASRNNRIQFSVINYSSGGRDTGTEDMIKYAVQSAVRSGMFMTVSAGNANVDVAGYVPANVAEACTIGATDNTDTEAPFSNYGAGVDFWAPGQDILAPSSSDDAGTRLVNGTSFSAPLAAGVGAVLKSYPPPTDLYTFSPVDLCNYMAQTATQNRINFRTYSDDIPGPNLLLFYGY